MPDATLAKRSAGTGAGFAAAIVLLWVLELAGVPEPEQEVAIAMGALFTAVGNWAVRRWG